MKNFKLLIILSLLVCAIFALCVSANATNYSGTCGGEGDGTNLTWSLNTSTGVLKINGIGEMKDWIYSDYVPWYSYRSYIKTVTLGNGVTSIGDRAFYNYDSLKSADIPNATSIGERAFEYCYSLKSVSMPCVTSIGSYAFFDCTYLANVDMPSVASIGYSAFYNCDSLKSVSMPCITNIGDGAFSSCYSLASVDMPNVINIGSSVFYNCSSLESADIPNATSIGERAFEYCYSLKDVSMPSVTSVGYGAFRYCHNLKKAVIYSTTATFSSYVFSNTHADFEIHGYTDSTAQAYANANEHPFVPLDAIEYIPGDVDKSGDVNIRDAALILQHLADWDVTLHENTADVDKSGDVNIRDAALILQFVAGWGVTLG